MRRLVLFFVLTVFIGNIFLSSPGFSQTLYGEVFLPKSGDMVRPGSAFIPIVFKGMRIYPDRPLRFDFLVNTGNADLKDSRLKQKLSRLIRYFLSALTVPDSDLWVNLSPDESDRIISQNFGLTEMGCDLLVQDYILKQLASSMMYPEAALGRQVWENIYAMAIKEYGTTDIQVDKFNKVWIVPGEAVVYVRGDTVFVARSRLKVMLDTDRQVMSKSVNNIPLKIMREIVLPEIEKEINSGKNFSALRQIYHAMILATWFKRNIKRNLMGRAYADKNKVKGIDFVGADVKNLIWRQYVESFRKGVFDYVKEEDDAGSGDVMTRRYFSGGFQYDGAVVKEERRGIEDMAMSASHDERYKDLVVGAELIIIPQMLDPGLVLNARDIKRYWLLLKSEGKGFAADRLIRVLASVTGRWDVSLDRDALPDAKHILQLLSSRGVVSLSELRARVPIEQVQDYAFVINGLVGFVRKLYFKSDGRTDQKIVRKSVSWPGEQMKKKLERLEKLRDAIQGGTLPSMMMFGDKHGETQDLARVVAWAEVFVRENCDSNKKLTVIGHGDSFDRGSQNVEVFRLLQRLKQLEADHPGVIEVHLLWGNHDISLMYANISGDADEMEHWLTSGGYQTERDFHRANVNIKELAVFMLKNFELFYVDEWGMIHVHGGIRMEEAAFPVVSRARMDEIQQQWMVLRHKLWMDSEAFFAQQENIQEIRALFRQADVKCFVAVKKKKWLDHLWIKPDDAIMIGSDNKKKLLKIMKDILRWQYDAPEEEIRRHLENNWQSFAIKNEKWLKAVGVKMDIMKERWILDKTKLSHFLDGLGVNGVFFGHIHYGVNIDVNIR